MRAGELKDRISIMELRQSQSGPNEAYTWEVAAAVWAKAEKLDKVNIFSSVGLGVKSVKFTIRKTNLTLHNAISWNRLHCFLTDIAEINRAALEITAALIEPKPCMATRTSTAKGDLNRPVETATGTVTFPGCLIEKYLGHNRGESMAEEEQRFVLVAPKPIELVSGELVKVDGQPYEVLLAHKLDEYKNEYEIERRHNP